MGLVFGIFLAIVSTYICIYISTFCHEHGHFFAAKLVGFQPYCIRLGSHNDITWRWFFNSKLELGRIPNGGLTFVSQAQTNELNLKTLKLKFIIFLLGGAFANLMLLLGLLSAFHFTSSPFFLIPAFLEITFLGCSLIPMDAMVHGKKHPNDAKILLSLLARDDAAYYKEVALFYQKSISKYGDESQKRFPFGGSPNRLQYLQDAQLAISYQHYDEAIRLLQKLLKLGNLSNPETAFILDTLISIVINQGQMQYLNQAEEWSKRAIKIAGQCKTIQGSRGAVLAELGRYAEAKELLFPLAELGNEVVDFTISNWYLAKIDHHLRKPEMVQYWLQQAENYGTKEPYVFNILNRILWEIQKDS